LFELHDHHIVGKTRLPRHPAQFGATPASLTGNSPALGEHTDAILTELGLDAQIAALRDAGVVA
jgi:crotonobetainyl-CoA:carnitine CoA-transferase CaiB-like acyl-CoA transferase